jgi:hypothetical protein
MSNGCTIVGGLYVQTFEILEPLGCFVLLVFLGCIVGKLSLGSLLLCRLDVDQEERH